MAYAFDIQEAFNEDAVESGRHPSLPPGTQYPAWVADVLSATSDKDLREALGEVFDDELAPTAPFYSQVMHVAPQRLGEILTADDWGKLVHIAMEESAFLQALKAFRREHEARHPPRIGMPPINVRAFVRDSGVPAYVQRMVLKMAYARLADTVLCHLANHGERHHLVPNLLTILEEGTKVKNDMFMVFKEPPVTFRQEREQWLKNSLETAITGEIAS